MTIGVLLVFLVFLGVYVDRVTPIRVDGGLDEAPTTVSISQSHLDWLQENYNEDLENGFCLFGQVDGNKVMVEDVEFVDNPWSQSKYSMRFNCVPQLAVRSGDLVQDYDYKFVGAIHTHPVTPSLSRVDQEMFRKAQGLIKVFGVFNGDSLRMYDRPEGPPIKVLLRAR